MLRPGGARFFSAMLFRPRPGGAAFLRMYLHRPAPFVAKTAGATVANWWHAGSAHRQPDVRPEIGSFPAEHVARLQNAPLENRPRRCCQRQKMRRLRMIMTCSKGDDVLMLYASRDDGDTWCHPRRRRRFRMGARATTPLATVPDTAAPHSALCVVRYRLNRPSSHPASWDVAGVPSTFRHILARCCGPVSTSRDPDHAIGSGVQSIGQKRRCQARYV